MKFKGKNRSFSDVDKEWIESIPKTINDNGCWIPDDVLPDRRTGYVRLEIGERPYLLHRLVMFVYHGVNYFDYSIETRHATGCDKACFYWKHLTPGLPKDNMQDRIRDGNHNNINKQCCPRCGSQYSSWTYRTGPNKHETKRYCKKCKRDKARLRGC